MSSVPFYDLDKVSPAWPQSTQLPLDTQLLDSLGILYSREAENVAAFLSALRLLCATHSCELSINGQKSIRGSVDVTLRTKLPRELVFAFIANTAHQLSDFNLSASTVMESASDWDKQFVQTK